MLYVYFKYVSKEKLSFICEKELCMFIPSYAVFQALIYENNNFLAV